MLVIILKAYQRKRIKLRTIAKKLREKIFSQEFLNSARKRKQYFTRKRKMPFPILVIFMLNMIRSSIQTCLNSFFKDIGLTDVHMTQQSFSEARQKIRWQAFRELFLDNVDNIYSCYYDRWQGYRLLAIDGTKIALPDDEVLKRNFGALGANKTAVTAQSSALYDVLNDVLVDVRIAPLSTGERKLALLHISELCKRPSFGKECILFDRGYASFELIDTLKKRNISFVMRVKRGFNLAIDALDLGDHTVVLSKRGRDDISVRVLKFMLSSGEIECLITDILENNIEDFKAIYFMRWPIETKFDEIKNKLEIENFSGRTVNAIRQDFFVTMLMSNIASVACWEAQSDADKSREHKNNKHYYKVNVNEAIGTLKDDFIIAVIETSERKRSKMLKRIIFLLAKSVVPSRTDRAVPRNKSYRTSKFRFNRKSNC